MKNIIVWIIALTIATIIFIGFLLALPVTNVSANDYIVTYYGQGVFSIEHDGVIHIQGKGAATKMGTGTDGGWGRTSNDNDQETEYEQNLKEAQQFESKGKWYYAMRYYQEAGETEKMIEMAYKDIEEHLAETPPYYEGATDIARKYLKDKELALEYYEKQLDQQLNSGGIDQ